MTALSRRDFTRLLAVSGSATFLPLARHRESLDKLGF
jgi:hypothetical protein